MALEDDLARIATETQAAAVLAAEPSPGERAYVLAFDEADGRRSWLAVDETGATIDDLRRVREAVSIIALCEVAEDVAAGGDLDELRAQLAALRVTENPPGIEEAEEAALALQQVLGAPPTLATPERLDAIGAATRRLESALGGELQGSPFAAAMKNASTVVEALWNDVAAAYRVPLR
jgi:hypothetical protein